MDRGAKRETERETGGGFTLIIEIEREEERDSKREKERGIVSGVTL